ncbi:MAG: hypothetical protein K2K52_03050 [Paramuribaculum sp.]|nr:hypothetical protein [Paramuribaculum sp.]
MNKFFVLAACFIGLTLFSCSDKGEDTPDITSEVESSPSFSYVVDASGNGKVYEGASYKVTFIDNKQTANIEMRGVRFTPNMNATGYIFSNLPFRGDDSTKAKIISIDTEALTPDKASSPVVTNLEMVSLAEKEIDVDGDSKPENVGGFAIRYIIDGKYAVTEIPYIAVFEGTTSTVNNNTHNSFVSSKSTYVVEIDPDMMKAVLKINDPSFDANMPSLGTMVFGSFDQDKIDEYGSIDVTLTEGGYSLKCNRLIPFIAGTPYPRFAITNLKMNAYPGDKSELSFNCMGIYSVTAVFGAAYTPGK